MGSGGFSVEDYLIGFFLTVTLLLSLVVFQLLGIRIQV